MVESTNQSSRRRRRRRAALAVLIGLSGLMSGVWELAMVSRSIFSGSWAAPGCWHWLG